jgi:hypothetical protein
MDTMFSGQSIARSVRIQSWIKLSEGELGETGD